MYLHLKEHLSLRGWQGLPYAIIDTRNGSTQLLDALSFQAISFCDGQTTASHPLLLPAHLEAIDLLKQAGIVEEVGQIRPLSEQQKYRKSEGHYAGAVHWSMTGNCNLACRHCYMSAPQAKYGELSTEQCLSIINQMAEANISKVSLTGGEPLVRHDFWQLVNALLDKGIVIYQLYTNGVLLTDEVLEQLKVRQIHCQIMLSHDGVGTHDWMRGTPGSEEASIEAIRLSRKHGFPVGVSTAVHSDNLHTLEETYDLLKSLDVGSWKLSPVVSTGNWAQEQGHYDVPLETLYETYMKLIQKHQADLTPFTLMLGGFYYCEKGSKEYHMPMVRYDGSEKTCKQPVCRSWRASLYLMADGRLLPCMPLTDTAMEDDMPNLLTTTLARALGDTEFFDLINGKLGPLFEESPICGVCEHRLRCGMGCRANALNSTGSYHGVDPDCCYFFHNGYEERIRKVIDETRWRTGTNG